MPCARRSAPSNFSRRVAAVFHVVQQKQDVFPPNAADGLCRARRGLQEFEVFFLNVHLMTSNLFNSQKSKNRLPIVTDGEPVAVQSHPSVKL
jgi:hypothetical protein